MQDRNYSNRDNNHRNNDGDGSRSQLFIAKGRNDGMDASSLVEFVSGKTNIDPNKISNVKLLDAFSFFAVPNEDAEIILDFFQEEAGEGRPLVSRAKRKKPSGDSGGGYRNDRRNFNDRPDRPRRDFGDRPRRDYNE